MVNTLSLGGDDVRRAFLAEIGIVDARDAKFLLQRRDLPIRSAKDRRDRVLLGISRCESRYVPFQGVDQTQDSVPDPWLYGDGFAVLVESKVGSFADPVLASLKAAEPFYDSFDVGNLPLTKSDCWVAFGPREYKGVTHQTISLASDGLRIFVNTETKPAIDRLRSVLKRSESELRRALQALHDVEPFELALKERTQRQAMLYDYAEKMRMHSSMLLQDAGDTAWQAFVKTVARMRLPNLVIERLLPPKN